MRDWQTEKSSSEWGSVSERSPAGSSFWISVIRNVPRTFPESVRICVLKKGSSNLDRAPKIQESVLLHCCHSFIVNLPSICSETCAIYSSVIPGTDMFRDWLFIGCSSFVSLETAAPFRLILNVAILMKGKK